MILRRPAVTRAVPALALLCGGVIAGCGSSTASDDTTTSASTTTVTRTETGTTPSSSSTRSTSTSTSTSGTSTTSGSTTGATGSVQQCVARDLALAYLGGQGATGHGELGFSLRNTSAAPCHTYGYPGIQFLDAGGGPLPTTPTHTTSDFFGHTTERPLTIIPGGHASFRLGVEHVASGGGSCATAHALRVIAPDDTATLTVTIPGGAAECGGQATVSPLQPGTAAFAH